MPWTSEEVCGFTVPWILLLAPGLHIQRGLRPCVGYKAQVLTGGESWKKGEGRRQDMGDKEITLPSQTHQMVLQEVFNSRQVETSSVALAVEHAI